MISLDNMYTVAHIFSTDGLTLGNHVANGLSLCYGRYNFARPFSRVIVSCNV